MGALSTAITTATLALVSQDRTDLRAAPSASAPLHASLAAGDTLEIRGERADYVQVYDHRRERAGFVPRSAVRLISLEKEQAPALLAVSRFLKESSSSDVLGIAYTAAFLRVSQTTEPEAFELIGSFAERLATRASNAAKGQEANMQMQLDSAAQYGVTFKSIESDSGMHICYDGDAHRRVLATSQSPIALARAALALSDARCVSKTNTPSQRKVIVSAQLETIENVKTDALPSYLKHRVNLRRASVLASSASIEARSAEPQRALPRVSAALNAFASVKRDELAESDLPLYAETAIRVSAVRPALDPVITGSLKVRLENGEPGQTCVHISPSKLQSASLIEKCTFGIVWAHSARSNVAGSLLTLAVQSFDGWRELWVFRSDNNKWTVDVLPPSAHPESGIGYVEFAGATPDGKQLLIARETKLNGHFRRSFELVNASTLNTERITFEVGTMGAFARWQDPIWKRVTLALRS